MMYLARSILPHMNTRCIISSLDVSRDTDALNTANITTHTFSYNPYHLVAHIIFSLPTRSIYLFLSFWVIIGKFPSAKHSHHIYLIRLFIARRTRRCPQFLSSLRSANIKLFRE